MTYSEYACAQFNTGVVEDAQNLILLGRGVEDRRTGDRIALACANAECTLAQVVYYHHESQTFTWHDAAIEINITDQKGTRKALRKMMSERTNVVLNRAMDNTDVAWIVTLGTCYGMLKGMQYLYLLTGMIGVSTLAPFLVVGVFIVFPGISKFIFNHSLVSFQSQGLDRNDWNWSSDSKKMMHFSFKRIKKKLSIEYK